MGPSEYFSAHVLMAMIKLVPAEIQDKAMAVFKD
jgi:hypothetical protein